MASRIDFFFAPGSIKVLDSEISPVWFSDHHGVRSVLEVGASVFGRGYWKMNVSMLSECMSASSQKRIVAGVT